MPKQYQRKQHIINDSRDSNHCNDLRKSLNSSERQRGKLETYERTQEALDHSLWCECYMCWDGYDNDKYYGRLSYNTYILERSVGGAMLKSLQRLELITYDQRYEIFSTIPLLISDEH